jgi:hypothetical protein
LKAVAPPTSPPNGDDEAGASGGLANGDAVAWENGGGTEAPGAGAAPNGEAADDGAAVAVSAPEPNVAGANAPKGEGAEAAGVLPNGDVDVDRPAVEKGVMLEEANVAPKDEGA